GTAMLRNVIRSIIPLAGLIGMLALPIDAAQAVEIRDDASFFSQKALDKANDRLHELKRTTHKEMRIETFKSVPPGKVDEVEKMDKIERSRFFEKWARERASSEHAKGIFVLICRHPGYVQVEEDRQTKEQGFGRTERNELRDKLLDGFRHKDYDK